MSVVSRPRPFVKVLSSSPCFSRLSRKVVVSRCSSRSPAAEADDLEGSAPDSITWKGASHVSPTTMSHKRHVEGVGCRTMGADHKRARGETSTQKRGDRSVAP